jgi:two-component system, cell cycle sensor histidine kinase and response regulator CckA
MLYNGSQQARHQQFASFLVENLHDAVYWIRRDGSFLYVNLAACKMLDYQRDELVSRSMFDINPMIGRESWSKVWQALAEQRHTSFQSCHQTRQGKLLTVDIHAYLFELEGEEYSCAIARDVSAVRPMEEQRVREHAFVESLLELAPVMVLLLDADGSVLRLNRCTERIVGRSLAELRGKNWIASVVPGADQARVTKLLQQSLSGAPMQGTVYRLQTKTGAIREVAWHDQLVSRADAVGMGLLAIGQDVTGQRELEQRLTQAEKMEAIGLLAGGIAHDFNNQLTGIMGWTEILSLEAAANPGLVECAQRIMQAAKRARDLTAQLLAYSRKGRYVTKTVNLHEIVEEAVAMLRRSLDKRITVAVALDAPRFHTVGDPTQLSNAVLNLGLNARDAMPNGGLLSFTTKTAMVSAAEASASSEEISAGELIELSVKDTGIGMDANTQRRMFEPFFTTKGEGRGTGMGLAAVYGTVKNHRGSIVVDSSIGVGTEIRIRLPIMVAAPNEEPVTSEPVVQRVAGLATALPLRVMVVDDEAPVREVATRMLRRLGCAVTSFASGFDAIDHYSQSASSVDVVILDMIMPMLDGKSTFQALRKLNPEVVVLLVSGYSLEGAAQSLLDQGAAGFLQKPFTLDALREALDSLVEPSVKLQA